MALGFEGFEVFADFDGDFFSEDGFEFEAGEAIAADAAADEHGPFVGGTTDEAEVGVVGATAAVGAAGHAEEDGFVFEAEIAEGGVDGIHEAGKGAFGLAEGEAAGGEGDAGVGDGAGAGEADVVGVDDAVFGKDGIDFGLIRGIDVGEDEVGVGGDDDGAADGFGDFAEAGAVLRAVGFVVDAAHADVDGAVEFAVALFVPAEVVFDGVELDVFGGEGFDAWEAAGDFGAEAVDAHGLHGILEASVFAFLAIAVVALGGDDSFDGVDDVGAMDVEEGLGEEGAGGEVAVVHAEAAADKEGVAFDRAVDEVGDEADVLGEDVGVIAGGDGDADFEFAGQVEFAVDGVFAFGGLGGLADGGVDLGVFDPLGVDFFTVEPDVGVGGGAPEEALGDFLGEALGISVEGVFDGGGGAHGVADDVAAGTHGGEAGVADVVNDFFETAFEDAVELDALAVGEAHVAHGFIAEVIMDEPLFGGDASAGHFGADHEAPSFFLFGFDEGSALVAVVLLVGAVVFEKDVGVVGDAGGAGVGEEFGELAAEAVGFKFDFFDGGF